MNIYQMIFNIMAAIVGGIVGALLQLYFQNKNNRINFKMRVIKSFHLCSRHSIHVNGPLGLMYSQCKICNKTWE